jgi:hypothetical protein
MANGGGVPNEAGVGNGGNVPAAAARAAPPPFNPYDPYYSAGMAMHFQQKLEEKEAELKHVRKTLEETQTKLQEQTLHATRLQAKLDQALASFESERKVIQLQAEKNAQEKIQASQQEVFQKQLELMDKWQKGMGTAAVPPLAPMEEPPPPTSQERPRPEVVAPSQAIKTQPRAAPPAATKTVEHPAASVKSGASNGRNDQSADTSLVDSGGISDEEDSGSEDYSDGGRLVAPPNTPAERHDVTSMNSGSAGASSQKSATSAPAQQSSNHFTPIYPKPDEPEPEQDGDDITLGQTVASSTYGEDRIKVVEKELLDPYGDKGTYTGVVLRTTGMPHGLGRMIYEEDGRIYEGDW